MFAFCVRRVGTNDALTLEIPVFDYIIGALAPLVTAYIFVTTLPFLLRPSFRRRSSTKDDYIHAGKALASNGKSHAAQLTRSTISTGSAIS